MYIKLMNHLLTSIIAIFLTSVSSKAFAVSVHILQGTTDAADRANEQVEGSRSILNTISMVNSYIWFFIGFFCFVFMIWNGYKLITGNGEEKAMKSAKTALLWSFIWLAICILAYIIVNIAVNLFA